MKKIKLLIFISILISTIFIYKIYNKKTYYLAFNDTMSSYSDYVYQKIKDNKTIYNRSTFNNENELLSAIKDNKKINNKTIQNYIFNANIITISFCNEDIFKILKQYNNSKIIYVGYECDITKNYNIYHIDLNQIFKYNDKLLYPNYPKPNIDGNKLIAREIVKYIKNS